MKPALSLLAIARDVDDFELSEDGKTLAFVTNEDGISGLHLLDTATRKELPIPKLPVGVIGGLRWHKNSHDLDWIRKKASATFLLK